MDGAPLKIDGVKLAIMQKRFEGVTRKMANTLLRTARSGVINTARDCSCALVTADCELLPAADSYPLHVLRGADLMARAMLHFHPDVKPGDAFLHNSPYHGNTHAADHTILVPVFDDSGVHRFTVLAKAHQADCGNSQPTTYMAAAADVYEEGALLFDACRVQSEYRDNEDIGGQGMRGEILGARVADRDGRVLLEQQVRDRLADDRAAADHDGPRACQRDAVLAKERDDRLRIGRLDNQSEFLGEQCSDGIRLRARRDVDVDAGIAAERHLEECRDQPAVAAVVCRDDAAVRDQFLHRAERPAEQGDRRQRAWPVGDVERDERDRARANDGDELRVVAVEHRRQDEHQDHRDARTERDERSHPAPAAERDDHHREQDRQPHQDRPALAIVVAVVEPA